MALTKFVVESHWVLVPNRIKQKSPTCVRLLSNGCPIGIELATWLASPIRVVSALASLGSLLRKASPKSLLRNFCGRTHWVLVPRTTKKPLLSQEFLWLSDRDSNPNKKSQNLLCYHYTIGQFSFCKNLNLAIFFAMSRFFLKNA